MGAPTRPRSTAAPLTGARPKPNSAPAVRRGRCSVWRLQRDVVVASPGGGGLRDGPGEGCAGLGGLDDLVDDTQVDGALQAACDLFVLLGELLLDGGALLGGDSGDLLAVQYADGGERAHDGDLGGRPAEHLGGAERPG